MTAHVRILTIKTVDSSPAILLVSPDGSKTLVNCGEGCQRSFLEHSQKLSTVNRVCLTHLAHDSIGGLPGMILTSADAAKASQMELMAISAAAAAAAAAGVPPAVPKKEDRKRRNDKDSNGNGHSNVGNTLGLAGLELVGPAGTSMYVRSLRHFMKREEFPIQIREGAYHKPPASSQEELSQKQRAKKKRKRQESKNYNGKTTNTSSSSNNNNNNNNDNNQKDSNISATEGQHEDQYFGVQAIPIYYNIPLPDTSSKTKSQVVSFLFTTPPVSGKFLPEKAKELGIPPGPLYAQLKAGKNVTFEDDQGVTHHVESSQVVLEPTPGVVVAILYYPNLDVWKQLQPMVDKAIQDQKSTGDNTPTKNNNVKLDIVLHLTAKEIFGAQECQEWRRQQSSKEDETQHVWLDTSDPALWRPLSSHSHSPFTSACVGALVRAQICPDIYKKPVYLETTTERRPTSKNDDLQEDNVREAEALLEYVLMPRSRRGFVRLTEDYLENCRHDAMDFASKSGAFDAAKEILNKVKTEKEIPGKSSSNSNCKAQLLFTGTGSAIPCKHRNVTGMCLRMEDGQAILLDVGEGTVGQLLRASSTLVDDSKDESEILTYEHLLRNIKAAWVSHPHADHHLGLLRLLTDRQAILHHHFISDNDTEKNDRLVVIGPPPILHFLQEYEAIDPRIGASYVGLDCRDLKNSPDRPRTSMPRIMKENSLLGGRITSMEAIPVAHCAYSFAVVLEGTTFGKVAYSGDCRPSSHFARRALGADLLIHEATFEDGMEAEATMKRHSTVGEALDVARQMKAKQVVLTHFSQRYPRIPPIVSKRPATSDPGDNTASSTTDIPVIFAFDFMAITPANLEEASSITPALRLLYPDEAGPEEEEPVEAPAAMSIPGFFAQTIH